MSPLLVFSIITGYFILLIVISWLTGQKSNTATFFTANKQSPWYLVAFGMIGVVLSGVTFISVPGEVGNTNFYYFQMVLGYMLGYFVIATVLMPMYYRLKLVSIYTYLDKRFGFWSYKSGAFFFLVSRTIGAAFRLFLVAGVLQIAFFDAYDIPFAVTVMVTILLIWVYTFKAGIKTIVWTDTLQTLFMISAVSISIYIIGSKLDLPFGELVAKVNNHSYSKIFVWDWQSPAYFFKQFFAGAFIAIVMTGLDQDIMQKNLTCRNIKEAKKNMFWFSIVLLPVNFLFLCLGALLYIYAETNAIAIPELSDKLFPLLALNHFGTIAGVVFLLGIVAAAFSSADSALTALTTSFCIDFLNIDIKDEKHSKSIRYTKRWVHFGFSVLLLAVILIFKSINDSSVISAVFKMAGYTYGPLLGLFSFGMFMKRGVKDKYVPYVAVLSPILSYILSLYSEVIFNGYKFGFELLIVNGLFTFMGLLILSYRKKVVPFEEGLADKIG